MYHFHFVRLTQLPEHTRLFQSLRQSAKVSQPAKAKHCIVKSVHDVRALIAGD